MGDTLRQRPNYRAAWPSVEGPSLLKYHPLFWAPDIANMLDYVRPLPRARRPASALPSPRVRTARR